MTDFPREIAGRYYLNHRHCEWLFLHHCEDIQVRTIVEVVKRNCEPILNLCFLDLTKDMMLVDTTTTAFVFLRTGVLKLRRKVQVRWFWGEARKILRYATYVCEVTVS